MFLRLSSDRKCRVVHLDQDSVYTSYRWLRAILLEDGMRVSYSENGAKGTPWIESLWGRLKVEIGSRISEASSLPELRRVLNERFRNYNQERRHSTIGNKPPRQYLSETIDSPDFEERILAASSPQLALQLVQKFGRTSKTMVRSQMVAGRARSPYLLRVR